MTAARKKSELTREHILATGRELVLRQGFGGMGLKELLDASGVPKGSFYYYFASKEAFGCALLDDYCAEYGVKLAGLFDTSASGRDKLMAYWAVWLDTDAACGMADRCLVVKLAAEISDLSEDMRLILNTGVERLVRRIAAVIVEGRDDGSLPGSGDPIATARAMYALWLGAAILAKLSKDQGPLREALRTTEQMLAAA